MADPGSFTRVLGPTLGKVFLYLLHQQHESGCVPNIANINTNEDQKISLTHHFIAALVACGCTVGSNPERALKWLIGLTPHQTLGWHDMNQLEALLTVDFKKSPLSFEPPYDLMHGLLQKLISQYDGVSYFIDSSSPQDGVFSNLWAIKVLAQATDRGLLPDPALHTQLQNDITGLLDHIKTLTDSPMPSVAHKDMALALRLQYQLHGKLEPKHQDVLQKLLQPWEENNGLWEIRRPDIRHAVPQFWELGFDQALIGVSERYWRIALVSTCYVIENLTPLREAYSEVDEPLSQTFRRLLCLFERERLRDVRQYFSSDYGHIQIMCRLLVAANAWIGPLNDFLLPHVVDKGIASGALNNISNPEYELDVDGIRETLRKWFKVDYKDELEPLTLGYSGARVVRVRPRLFTPAIGLQGERREVTLPGVDSLVVKYGPHKLIKDEVTSYSLLPPHLRAKFVTIPSDLHDNGTHLFAVIQDLSGYETLQELLPKARQQNVSDILGRELITFLKDFHAPGLHPVRPAPVRLARRLYLEPAWRYLRTVFSLFYEPVLYEFLQSVGASAIETARDAEAELRTLLTELYVRESTLNRFHMVYMHGDLHVRNIMLRVTRETYAPLLIRLIDLENVTSDGDYAYDIGELRVSLRILERESGDGYLSNLAMSIREELTQAYRDIAEANNDELFDTRLALAECRATLRVAHAKSKEGRLYLRSGKVPRTSTIVRDALRLVGDARDSLREVHEHLLDISW